MTGSISAMPALTQWSSLARTSESDRVARFVKNNKTLENAHANFETAVRGMKSTSELFEARNYRALEYVLTACGPQSEIGNTGKLQRVLESDLSDENSLADRMDDRRFRDIAGALDFKNGGLTNLQDSGARAGIRARCEREAYRIDLGNQNPALRRAECFKNNISGASDIYSVPGDRTFREVVQKVGGMPSGGQLAQMRERMFQKADANGDGSIDKTEFGKGPQPPGMGKAGMPSSDRMFAKIDGDGNGALSKDELKAFGDKMSAQMKSVLMGAQENAGDENGSPLDALFKAIDSDEGGSVSKSEFEAFGKRAREGGSRQGGDAYADALNLLPTSLASLLGNAKDDGRRPQDELIGLLMKA